MLTEHISSLVMSDETVNIYMYGSTCSIIGERAKRARHYQGCTNSSWCGTYMYGGTYAIIVAHATYT